MKKESFEAIKRDPLTHFYRALNYGWWEPEEKEKLERAIVLLEKIDQFEELFDLWHHESTLPYKLCESILRGVLTGYLKIYPLGKVDEVSGKTIHFRVNNIAYGSTPVYYQKVSYAPQTLVNSVKKVKPHSALRDLPTGETND